ncbi:winged helix-turn-helix domain-containing protein [Methylogaea oryzae]|uniref:winged helix-turn-helix domain-containing protein n=1 Tax=Methylogaea oryzae TaxID=1295382 RepID=UPI0020D12D4C|nr:winged helix-turn-helix domain-containing protein [Methylogaea oryzae]
MRVHLKHRALGRPGDVTTQRVGAAEVDFGTHRVLREGVPLDISAKELDLLRYLVERRGQVVSRDRLLSDVWGYRSDVSTRTVDTFVARLRKKIEADPSHPAVLLTIHGLGYKIVSDI